MYAAGYPCRPLRSSRRRPPPWRLVGRGALVAVCCLLVSAGLARAVAGSTQPPYSTVTVTPGDTLWSIASDRYPGDDPRVRVAEIMQMNNLAGPVIEVGEALKVPAR